MGSLDDFVGYAHLVSLLYLKILGCLSGCLFVYVAGHVPGFLSLEMMIWVARHLGGLASVEINGWFRLAKGIMGEKEEEGFEPKDGRSGFQVLSAALLHWLMMLPLAPLLLRCFFLPAPSLLFLKLSCSLFSSSRVGFQF